MRRDDICLYLTADRRAQLKALIADRNTARKLVWRAEIVLATADRHGTNEIMRGAERPFATDAWVVLPDHLHAVWTLPVGDMDYSTRWGAIKARFSRAVRRAGFTPPPVGRENGGVNPALRRKGKTGLWQPRFWEHHIRDAADYDAHVRYWWGNPVKNGFVARPQDWLYSSVYTAIRDGWFDP